MPPSDSPLHHKEQTVLSDRTQPDGLRVIMALDRWSQPVETARFLSVLLPGESRVRIVTVVAYQGQPDSPWSRLGDEAETKAQVAATQSADFYGARRLLERLGAEVSITHRYGHAADEVLAEAVDWCADLIVVGHHNHTTGWFLGSATEALVKRSRVPVLVVPREPVPEKRSAARRPETLESQPDYDLRARPA